MNKNTNTKKIIIGENSFFLENLFSHMVLYCISEIEKNNFIQYILEANIELENPFDINEVLLEKELKKLIEDKQIVEEENYYYILKRKVLTKENQNNAHNYHELIQLYIQKNMKENPKVKKQVLTNQKEA